MHKQFRVPGGVRMGRGLGGPFLLLLTWGVLADATITRASDVDVVQPFLRTSTFLIAKIEPAAWTADPAAGTAQQEVLPRLESFARSWSELVGNQPIFATVGIPISRQQIPAYLLVRKPAGNQADKLLAYLRDDVQIAATAQGDYIVATPWGTPQSETSAGTAALPSREYIAAGFESLAGFPVQVLVIPPDYVRRTFRELSPELPQNLGGGPSSLLTDGIQWLAIGVNPRKLEVAITVQSASSDTAKSLAGRTPVLLRSVVNLLPQLGNEELVTEVRTLVASLRPQVEGSRITLKIDGQAHGHGSLKIFTGLARTIEDTVHRRRADEQFKQLLLALHNFHDVHKSFPPPPTAGSQDGKPRLSWRVHLLPYLDQGALYREFKLNESWDSPHNKALLAKMPDVFVSRGVTKPGYTCVVAPVGEKTLFGQATPVPISKITDGTSNTVAIVEVVPERAVPWTAPEDFTFDPQNPLQGVRTDAGGRWLCAFADGSVHRIKREISAATALHLFQINDGHVIPSEAY